MNKSLVLFLFLGSIFPGIVLTGIYNSIAPMFGGTYSVRFGFLHPPDLVRGVLYAAPLYVIALLFRSKVAFPVLINYLGITIVVAMGATYLLSQEIDPNGQPILISAPRLSGWLPLLALPLTVAVLRRLEKKECRSGPNDDQV